MAEDETLNEKEKEELANLLGYGSNLPDSKATVHAFLNNVARAKDTTKLGFLKNEELGNLQNPVRAHKFLESFARDIMNKPQLAHFFAGQSEIATATSLSREGFLVKQATVSTSIRKIADVTPEKKKNKSWFKSKDNKQEGETV